MKLLLISTGLENRNLSEKMIELVGKGVSLIRMLFIPAAGNFEEDKSLIKRDEEDIFKLGILKENFFEYDLDFEENELNMDIMYIEGGNTFYLLDRVKKTGFYKKVRNFVKKEGVYAGVSPGGIIAGDNIESFEKPQIQNSLRRTLKEIFFENRDYSKSSIDTAFLSYSNDSGIKYFNGLNLIDDIIFPYYNIREEDFIRKFEIYNICKGLKLKDKEALLFVNEKYEVII